MAYRFVENDVMINNYHGISIYHLAKDDLEDAGWLSCWYTTDQYGAEEEKGSFDIREMPGYDPTLSNEMNLTRMIDAGLFGETDIMDREGGLFDVYAASDKGIKEGCCPICGHNFNEDDYGDPEVMNDQVFWRITCPVCGASGRERGVIRFDSYEMD